ncbi:MAG TPA: hypothetical protein VLJ14_13865 [Ktedonobacterales bacterium]|jgi:hypothetical protein|nr:hypothetical protein [Ktedonobacterales bacterium]
MGQQQMGQGQMSNLMQLQQRRIAELETENRDLRRQLDELRRGAGIAVLIEGQAIPLTTLAPAPVPRPPVLMHPTHLSQPISAMPAMPATFAARPSTTSGRMPAVRGTAAPSTPYPRMPMQRPSTPSVPVRVVAPTRDDGWLTGATPAVRPWPLAAMPAARPSSGVTPAWLRDEAPTVVVAPVAPVAPVSQPAPVSQMLSSAPRRRLSTGPLARPSVPRLQPAGFPTLAQITGQMRAVRAQPQPELWPGERNPYADSFVLG